MRRSCAVLFWSLGGCVLPDPNHCANLEGDASCPDGQFCSSCLGSNAGCSTDQPSAACAVPGKGQSQTSESSSSSTGEGGPGTSSVDECEGDGAVDACPSARPVCSNRVCVSCVDTDVCGGDEVCIPEWDRCAECSPFLGEGCAENEWCGDDFSCGGCTRHEQCPDSACDLSRGECMSAERVFYVDSEVCPEVGLGTEADPFCELGTVLDLDNTPSGESSVAIVIGHGSEAYPENIELPGAWPRRLAVLGRGDVTIGLSSLDGPTFHVKTGSRLFLHNVTVTRSTDAGVRCADAEVWVDESEVTQNAAGIIAEGCRVTIRRSIVSGNDGDGVSLAAMSALRLESSGIVGNGEPQTESVALRSNESSFDVTYSTIVGNAAALGPGGDAPHSSLLCTGGMGGPVRNSVVVAPELTSISCPWAFFEASFLDTPGLDVPGSMITENWDPTWFEDLDAHDIHIRNPDSNPWRELALWGLEDPQRDLDGASRRAVPGTVGAAGADEP